MKRLFSIFYFLFSLFVMPCAFAQVGALPYHYKQTTRTGTGGPGADYVLTFEIHDANHVVKGTDTCNYSSAAKAQEIRDCISEKVKARAAADAGSTAALITAMLGVDNDMDSAPAPSGSGISTLNTLTGSTQTFATGTAGTDFGISSSGTAHTFNLPTASASNRGALSTTDWSAFNAKEAALTFSAPLSRSVNTISCLAASGTQAGCLASADWTTFNDKQAALGFTPENSANKGAASGYAPLNASSRVPIANLASGTPNGSQFIRDDGALATPSGGSDPWTYVTLASDFVTSSSTAVDVTGLAFTPAASTRYEIYGYFMTRTATATVGPRPGNAWPTGLTDGVATFKCPSSATAIIWGHGNINAAVQCVNTGLVNTTQSWPNTMEAMLLAGATPSGTFKVQLASETGGTNVTMVAGSFIRYRTIP